MIRTLLKAVGIWWLAGCAPVGSRTKPEGFDIEGHRGARGLMPENTVPAFITAIDLGVNTLEMDLAVTRDHRLVVSHDPFINGEYCLDLNSEPIPKDQEMKFNIYSMTYQQVARYDCGSRGYADFPQQQKMPAGKPLLSVVIDTVETYLLKHKLNPVHYNIEIKSRFEYDEVYYPKPEEYCRLVYETINKQLELDRVTIQSFDFRILQYFRQVYPRVRLALLIENDLLPQENLDSLGFNPDVYSPYYKLIDEGVVNRLHEKDIAVIPWTINDPEEMERLRAMGVDGIITDYPDRIPKTWKKLNP